MRTVALWWTFMGAAAAALPSPSTRNAQRATRNSAGRRLIVVRDGPRNVGAFRREGRVLLINSAGPEALARAGVEAPDVEWVLVTHHHRSAAEGLADLAAAGAKVAVPEAERDLFERAEAFWGDDALYRVHGYNFHPSPRTLRESVPVARGLTDGEVIEWRGLRVRALATPGPTAGGMSYLVEIDGETSTFIGDLMSGPGKLWEFYSLQGRRPLPDGGLMMEYHGFGDRAEDVLRSLEGLLGEGPARLIPSHGDVIEEPLQAVDALRRNLEACLANYCSISAARWYFAGARPEWPADVAPLARRLRPLPKWVREPGNTTRAIVAETGAALLMDAWGDTPQRIQAGQQRGELGRVEGLWITHYHDDHVGAVNALRAAQGCPVIAHETMADILRRPDAYRMPCLEPEPIAVDRVTGDRESWEWRGARLTAYSFPGQTLLDAALLVEVGKERVLFVGDSLGPGGIDDYCLQNRNLLGPGLGHDACLALLEELGPDCLLVNPHVEGAFAFTAAEVQEMRETLAQRRELLAQLLAWEDPNYGLDPQWVRCDPYFQRARPGEAVEWTVHVRNYSSGSRTAAVRLRAPEGWESGADRTSLRIRPGGAGSMRFVARVPERMAPGRVVVGFTLRYGGRELGKLAEGVVAVEG